MFELFLPDLWFLGAWAAPQYKSSLHSIGQRGWRICGGRQNHPFHRSSPGIYSSGGCVVQVTQSENGFYVKDLESRLLTRENTQIQYTIAADSPGWLLFGAKRKGSKEKESRIGAMVSPLDIKPGMPPPDDFQIFWKNQVEQMQKLRGEAALTKVESHATSITAFDLTIDMGKGNPPVSGYLAYPESAKDKSLSLSY
jgi:hypothetical protein